VIVREDDLEILCSHHRLSVEGSSSSGDKTECRLFSFISYCLLFNFELSNVKDVVVNFSLECLC